MTKCGKCGARSQVFDSRFRHSTTFRRRKCIKCGHRWTTKEVFEADDCRPGIKVVGMDKKRLRYAAEILKRLINEQP
jgi:transcriptional regulator NrdR family protein